MSAGAERDDELEELLRRADGPAPDPRFRARARATFLAQGEADATGSRPEAPVRMGRVMPGALDPDEEDAFLDWIADLSAEAPGATARRRARLAFLTAVGADAPPPPPRVSRRRHVLAILAAAAAILAVTWLLPERERWRVRLDGAVLLDGRAYAPGEEARLAAELAGPGTLETELAPVHLSAGPLDLELLAGARLVLAALPPLDGASPLDLELPQGELFLRTSPRWPGNPILVRTPAADVMLHGTTVGVLADELGTCVCVADGTARVLSPNLAGFSRDVPAGSTLRVYAARGQEAEAAPFPADDAPEAAHTGPLLDFHRGP